MFAEEGSGCDVSLAPPITIAETIGRTRAGVIAGTAAYMSPEQARGKAVDRRTDIWAFGCVLLEMLSGRQAFAADSVSDTLVAILDRDPDWTALPDSTPPAVRRLLRRCLEKDVKRRVHHIADVRIEIEDALGAPAATETLQPEDTRGRPLVPRRRTVALVMSAAALGAVAVLA